MFVRIEKTDLLAGINMAMKAVSMDKNLPVLSCLLLDVSENGVQLTGNSLDMSIQTAVIPSNPSMEQVTGMVALDAKIFADIIKNFPEGEVIIETGENYITTIKSGKSKFKIGGICPEEFPVVSDVEPISSFTIDSAVLCEMIRRTIFCVSKNDKKNTLTGELIKLSAGHIEICAIDGYRIARCQSKADYSGQDFSVIVPGKTLSEIVKLLPANNDSKVTLEANKKMIRFSFEGVSVVSILINGEFVKYDSHFTAGSKTNISLNRAEFLGAIERTALIGDKTTPAKLKIQGSSMQISSRSQLGNMDEEISVDHEGDGLTIAFNPLYLRDALKAMSAETVDMQFIESLSPCILHGTGVEDCKYLVLPVRTAA